MGKPTRRIDPGAVFLGCVFVCVLVGWEHGYRRPMRDYRDQMTECAQQLGVVLHPRDAFDRCTQLIQHPLGAPIR